MKKSIFIGFLLTILGAGLAAQVKKDPKSKTKNCSCKFQSVNQVGLLEGEAGSSFQLQSINGLRYKTWFAGLGAGIDYYSFRGIPVFVDVRKDWWKKINTPFVYTDAGIHFSWVGDKNQNWWGRSEFSNGLFYDLGLGYKVGLNNKNSLLLSGGFSHKNIREKRFTTVYCINPPCTEGVEMFRYKLNRISLKAGWQF